MELLKTIGISKTYSRGSQKIEALKAADLTVNTEEFLCITGRSGSGKSTLLNILGFLTPPSDGKIFFKNSEIKNFSVKNLTMLRRKNTGFIFQQLYLQDHLTAVENTALPLKYQGIPEKKRNEEAGELLEAMGLSSRLNFYPSELSGGESQRVAVARALINNPGLLLADEPTSELDSDSSQKLMEILRAVSKQKKTAVIVVTHDNMVTKYADRLLTMEDGILKC